MTTENNQAQNNLTHFLQNTISNQNFQRNFQLGAYIQGHAEGGGGGALGHALGPFTLTIGLNWISILQKMIVFLKPPIIVLNNHALVSVSLDFDSNVSPERCQMTMLRHQNA